MARRRTPTWASMAWAAGAPASQRVQTSSAHGFPAASRAMRRFWVTALVSPEVSHCCGFSPAAAEKSPLAMSLGGASAASAARQTPKRIKADTDATGSRCRAAAA
ncbi:MAG: hypothetical protein ACHRHE_12670 [Tepidisphaerales bacterium]